MQRRSTTRVVGRRQLDWLVLLGEEVCAVTTKLGKKPRGPLQLRENRSCQSYLHASMSLWYEGLLFEQRIHKFFRIKGQQIANFLAHADKSHREAQLARDGHNHATLRGAVEFGQHDAGHPRRLREQPSLLQAVLTGSCVHDEKRLVRRTRNNS